MDEVAGFNLMLADIQEELDNGEHLNANDIAALRQQQEELRRVRRAMIDRFFALHLYLSEGGDPAEIVAPDTPLPDPVAPSESDSASEPGESGSEQESGSEEEQEPFCMVCFAGADEVEGSLHPMPCGGHFMCDDDLRLFLFKASKDLTFFPLACCNVDLNPRALALACDLPGPDRARLLLRHEEFYCKNKMYCPTPTCSAFINLDRIAITKEGAFLCPGECGATLCSQCKSIWHKDLSCAEFQALPEELQGSHDYAAVQLAIENLWQQCSKCRRLVEKRDGCLHMSCLCSHHFCYACGGEWTTCRGNCGVNMASSSQDPLARRARLNRISANLRK